MTPSYLVTTPDITKPASNVGSSDISTSTALYTNAPPVSRLPPATSRPVAHSNDAHSLDKCLLPRPLAEDLLVTPNILPTWLLPNLALPLKFHQLAAAVPHPQLTSMME